MALFWLWINPLPFDIDNQRKSEATTADALNKDHVYEVYGVFLSAESYVFSVLRGFDDKPVVSGF